MSPIAETVIERLDATRQRWWLFTLLSTAVGATCVSLAVLLAFLAADALWRLSQATLLTLFLVWLAISLALAAGLFRRLLGGQRSLEATARRVEAHLPEAGSNLINLVQFAEDGRGEGAAFRMAAVGQAAAALSTVRFDRAAEHVTRFGRFRFCMQTSRDLVESSAVLTLLLAVALGGHLMFPTWGSAAHRLFAPWSFVPQVGAVEIVKVTPGDVEVLVGSGLEITATIRNPQRKSYAAAAWIATGDSQEETRFTMTADKGGEHFRLSVPAVTGPLRYRLEIGDSQTRVYRVGVRRKPTVAEVEVVYHFPAYLGRPSEAVRQSGADLEAPQYTVAELRIRPSTVVARGWVESRGAVFGGNVTQEGALVTVAKLPMVASGVYTIHLENDAGHFDPDPRPNRMTVTPDRSPSAALVKPPRQTSAAPGETVALALRATDDYGLDWARLEMRLEDAHGSTLGAGGPPLADPATAAGDKGGQAAHGTHQAADGVLVLRQWSELGGKKEIVLRHELTLDPAAYPPGRTILVRAVAADQRRIDASQWGEDLRPQESAGPWHAIRLVEPDQRAEAQMAELDALRAAIYKILLDQIRTRIDTARLPKVEAIDQAVAIAGRVRTGQVGIQKATAALAESIRPSEQAARERTRRVLGTLATGDMIQAVRQAEQLVEHLRGATAGSPSSAEDTAGQASRGTPAKLMGTQQAIIAALRGLLDVVRRAQTELLAAMQKRPGADLPEDVRKKLEAAKAKLEEFLRQQKKVIEATENLAKKPVEDFTEEEKELMRQLAATEDDWARFLKELHSDLSKLPEQDFANPSLLSELNEIQTEIKMAEDALTKKTADIAVPLEQLGAEMAEELLTNMEKWLPDTPDRDRWSQEESLTDLDKEAPMAELPGELEDLVGELFEEEEDLFDEMEDVSSSATDSLDVGAGWDAMDGPISNMSAKGVTGNRLPNTSEIGGRSGEGRSGKSSGEFVAEEAVGKGGRKTPSRLTPDPYEKGQVKDHSKDPVGGATGGGKESGQGGEGLEGPQRRAPGQRELQRLAGKQAALRNKAEAIDLKFQVTNFHRTDLKRLIEVMAQVERDLKSGRYRNALRQRSVLVEGLGGVKQYVEGQVELRQDTSVNLPADVQKEMLGGMQDPSPAGWEELNRRYYQRLSKGERSE